MASVKLHAGVELHNLSPDEVRGIVTEEGAVERARLRGITGAQLPRSFGATPTGGTFTLGTTLPGPSGFYGPDNGYIWYISRLIVNGLTAGATPDVINLFFDDSFSQIQWQFNGNNFGYTFSRSELLLNPGQGLMFRSGSPFATTSYVSVAGQYWIIPAEMAGRLVV